MDKLIIPIHRPSRAQVGDVIRIDDEARDAILQLQRESGLPIRKLASELIKYAAARTEFRQIK